MAARLDVEQFYAIQSVLHLLDVDQARMYPKHIVRVAGQDQMAAALLLYLESDTTKTTTGRFKGMVPGLILKSKESFKKDMYITKYHGYVMPQNEHAAIVDADETGTDLAYTVQLSAKWYLDGRRDPQGLRIIPEEFDFELGTLKADKQMLDNLAQRLQRKMFALGAGIFANHSETPNAKLLHILSNFYEDESDNPLFVAEHSFVCIRALVDIPAGTEITIDYGEDFQSVQQK